MLVMWVATSSLIVTGYRGGQNVYRYGVGVSVDAIAEQASDKSAP
jgi:uncharacterized membrane protein